MGIAVYTCITNNLEELKIEQNYRGADFFLFTDNILTPVPDGWRKRLATSLYTDPRRNARYHKMLSHLMFPQYDYTIWLDGSMTMKVTAKYLVDQLGSCDVGAFKHPDRDCSYKEIVTCKQYKLDYPEVLDQNARILESYNYPRHNGLSETKIVVRRNNDRVKLFNETWFYHFATGSVRCQVNFDFAIWKTGTNLKQFTSYKNTPELFDYTKHERKTYK